MPGSDWLSRATIPDVYPRRDDPFRPAVTVIPGQAPAETEIPPPGIGGIPYSLTTPGQRPYIYQNANNLQLTVQTAATRLQNQRFECDTIVIDVPSTAANSVFFGFGTAVSLTSGIEIQPGIPLVISPENSREQWELQRALELIAALLAFERGVPDMGPYRAPRVVFNAFDYCLIAAAPTIVSIMLFYVTEQ